MANDSEAHGPLSTTWQGTVNPLEGRSKMTNSPPNFGLTLSSFIADVAANRPTDYPGNENVALYYATDTGALYIAVRPTAVFGVYGACSWSAVGGGAVIVPDAAAYTALVADSGRDHVMPDETANITVTLPPPTVGLRFPFIGKAGAADAQSWILSAGAVILKGGVIGMDTDAGAGSDELVPAYANGSTHVKVTIATPEAGTRVVFIADGTNWLVSGQVCSAAAPVFS